MIAPVRPALLPLLVILAGITTSACSTETEDVDAESAALASSTTGLWQLQSCAADGDFGLLYLDRSSSRFAAIAKDTSWAHWFSSSSPYRPVVGDFTIASSAPLEQISFRESGGGETTYSVRETTESLSLERAGSTKTYARDYAAWCSVDGREHAGIIVHLDGRSRLTTFGGDGDAAPSTGTFEGNVDASSLFAEAGGVLVVRGTKASSGERLELSLPFADLHSSKFRLEARFDGASGTVRLPLTCHHRRSEGGGC